MKSEEMAFWQDIAKCYRWPKGKVVLGVLWVQRQTGRNFSETNQLFKEALRLKIELETMTSSFLYSCP